MGMTVPGVAAHACHRRHGGENEQPGVYSAEEHSGSAPGWVGTCLDVAVNQNHRCRKYYSPEAETDSQGE